MGDESELTLVMRAKDFASKSVHGLSGSLGGLHTAAGKAGGGLKNLGGGIANAGKMAGVVAIGGIATLAAALGFATKQAADEETGIKKMDAALKANVKGWNGNTDAIEATIAKREKLAFSDDDLRASMSILVTRFHDVGKASSLQATAMDLARLKGVDLETASTMLGKALSGNKKVLKDLGIQLPKTATETQILAAIQKASAGQAEAYGKTSKGAMEAFQIAAGDLVEDIGGAFLPVMTAAFKFLTDTGIPAIRGVIAAITSWVTQNQPLINQITSFVGGALSTAANFLTGTLIPAVVSLATQLGSVLVPMIQGIVAAITSWVASNQPLIAQIAGFVSGVLDTFIAGIDSVRRIFTDFGPVPAIIAGVTLAVIALSAAVSINPIVLIIGGIILAVGLLRKAWDSNFGGIRTIVGAVATFVGQAGARFGVIFQVIGAAVGVLGQAFGALGSIISRIWEGITGMFKSKANFIIAIINGIIRAIDAIHFGIGPIDVGPVHFDGMQFKGFNIPQIPYLANGAIVRQPTIAMIGEAGPEAVVPLGRGGASATPAVIQINLDGRQLGRVVDEHLYYALQRAAPTRVRV